MKTQIPAKPAKPAAMVKMVRPEDRQLKPCVAEVPEDKVSEWTAAGWAVRSDAEIAKLMEASEAAAAAEAPAEKAPEA